MKLTDLPRHGFLPKPRQRQPRNPQRTTDRCPECRKGYVTATGSDDPTDVRYVCSRRCGWDA